MNFWPSFTTAIVMLCYLIFDELHHDYKSQPNLLQFSLDLPKWMHFGGIDCFRFKPKMFPVDDIKNYKKRVFKFFKKTACVGPEICFREFMERHLAPLSVLKDFLYLYWLQWWNQVYNFFRLTTRVTKN